MVEYPDLSSLNNQSGIAGLMQLPNASYPYYWLWIFVGIWFIITLTTYFVEKDKLGKGKLLSSMAVSSLAIIILSTIGSILGIITSDIFTYILVFSFMVIGIWFFSGKN